MIGSFLSSASSPWSQFFQFVVPRLCSPCFSFGKFSLVAYFRSAYRYSFYPVLVSCLLSCRRCTFTLHSIEIAYRSAHCNYRISRICHLFLVHPVGVKFAPYIVGSEFGYVS